MGSRLALATGREADAIALAAEFDRDIRYSTPTQGKAQDPRAQAGDCGSAESALMRPFAVVSYASKRLATHIAFEWSLRELDWFEVHSFVPVLRFVLR